MRAQTREIVVGCAASHTAWMEEIVIPNFEAKHGATVLFEGTKSTVNLEKMRGNRDDPYLSVVQMDDPVMILAVEEGVLAPMSADEVPNLTKLRDGAVHLDGMWANSVQPWAGIAYNTGARDGVMAGRPPPTSTRCCRRSCRPRSLSSPTRCHPTPT
ncbi:hypothetical protein [Acuticoccus sp.]|uniref:hypothetical protein n=1 Tax=Acuticoccus sp. TaxID=1904378 RepID=UPI003B52E40C